MAASARTEPVLDRRAPDLVQLLLRDGDEAFTRAKVAIQMGGADRIILAQDLQSASESLHEAAEVLAPDVIRAQKEARRAG